MANQVTSTAQLSTFETIRDILLTNSTLSARFQKSDFLEFEPKLKSLTNGMLPYIVIEIPSTETELLVMDHSTNLKEFSINIIMVISYDARTKFKTYANAIISVLEAADNTLETAGYYNTKIDLVDSGLEIIQEKDVVVGNFELNLTGNVVR